jgi:hypothetical protein
MEPNAADENMRCPTCRAEQPWSDQCRRCKSDLTLLRATAQAFAWHRRECLRLLRLAQFEAALEQARLAFALHADADSRRLLAVCALWNGDYSQARELVETGEG